MLTLDLEKPIPSSALPRPKWVTRYFTTINQKYKADLGSQPKLITRILCDKVDIA